MFRRSITGAGWSKRNIELFREAGRVAELCPVVGGPVSFGYSGRTRPNNNDSGGEGGMFTRAADLTSDPKVIP